MNAMIEFEPITHKVIGMAIEVHRELGPGLLESAYELCLCHELTLHEVAFRRQVPLPIRYKGLELESGYRIDLIVEDSLIIEVKAAEKVLPVHKAQLLTYLKLAQIRTGLLINFHVSSLRDGINRIVL